MKCKLLFEHRRTVQEVLSMYILVAVAACAMSLYLGFKMGEAITYISANCIGYHVK